VTGEELTPWLIRYAYSQGAFPMTMDEGAVEWFQPVNRALFDLAGIHTSRSLRRVLKTVDLLDQALSNHKPQIRQFPVHKNVTRPAPYTSPSGSGTERERKGTNYIFSVSFDQAFEDVMRACLRPGDNWISEDFIRVYTQIHIEGWGHSVEVWQAGNLVGGLYGVAIGSCFCAESMFHCAANASKVALWAMVHKCRSLGFTIFDAQVMNPHLESLGAYPVPHSEYMEMLGRALEKSTDWSITV